MVALSPDWRGTVELFSSTSVSCELLSGSVLDEASVLPLEETAVDSLPALLPLALVALPFAPPLTASSSSSPCSLSPSSSGARPGLARIVDATDAPDADRVEREPRGEDGRAVVSVTEMSTSSRETSTKSSSP